MEAPRSRPTVWVIGLAAILFALASHVAFGAPAEHAATLEAFAGEVKVLQGGTTPATPTLQMFLRCKDVIYTGKSSSATIVFPDGSAIQLEPKTRFTIQLLEYAGGQRRRSFSLHYGSVVARISHFFGAGSKASISTPTAVAAARGTGFRLSYDALTALTTLAVTDGTVEFTCGGIMTLCHAGETIFARGRVPGTPQETSPDTQGQFLQQMNGLEAYEIAPTAILPSVTETPPPTEAPTNRTEQTEPPVALLVVPLVLLPKTNPPPTELPSPPPFTPAPQGSNSQIQGMNWTVPGILGAGILAAVMSGGGSRGDSIQPVPEPGGLLVLGVGITGLVGVALQIRARRGTSPK